MKNTIKALAIIIISASSISWISKSDVRSNLNNASIEHNDHGDTLSLNKGKRWEANAETTTGVNNMIKIMETFSSTKDVKASKNYNGLSANLKAELDKIFDKCTMKGESHNQLHTFLVPIFGQLKALNSEDLNTCKNGFKDLDFQLAKYAEYFE